MNRANGAMAWAHIRDSWEEINAQFPSNTIVRMLTGIRWLADPETAADVETFFDGRTLPQGQKQLDQHLERLRVNAAFKARVVEGLSSAL